MSLNTKLNFHQTGKRFFQGYRPGDNFYEALIAAHHGLSDEQSEKVNTRLILLLANQIGELNLLREALDIARKDIN